MRYTYLASGPLIKQVRGTGECGIIYEIITSPLWNICRLKSRGDSRGGWLCKEEKMLNCPTISRSLAIRTQWYQSVSFDVQWYRYIMNVSYITNIHTSHWSHVHVRTYMYITGICLPMLCSKMSSRYLKMSREANYFCTWLVAGKGFTPLLN